MILYLNPVQIVKKAEIHNTLTPLPCACIENMQLHWAWALDQYFYS